MVLGEIRRTGYKRVRDGYGDEDTEGTDRDTQKRVRERMEKGMTREGTRRYEEGYGGKVRGTVQGRLRGGGYGEAISIQLSMFGNIVCSAASFMIHI